MDRNTMDTNDQADTALPRLGYDRAAVARLRDTGQLEVDAAIARAMTGDDDGLDVIRQIVEEMNDAGGWSFGTNVTGGSFVGADFTCDAEGFIVNDDHLTLSVFVGRGACVADTGLRRMRDLPLRESAVPTVYDVLDGVVAVLDSTVADTWRALSGTATAVPDRPCGDQDPAVHHIGIAVREAALTVHFPAGNVVTVAHDDPATAELYDTLCAALDALETATAACAYHEGTQRDATACTCTEPTICEGE